ncbi:MAG: hypothetical protein ACOZAM_16330 [Pseudomonadota bacterium]
MDKRAQLILERAQELFGRDHPGRAWPVAAGKTDTVILALQGRYLAHAEDRLLAEGAIEPVDQS